MTDPRTFWIEFGTDALAFVSVDDQPPSLVYWGPRPHERPDDADMALLAQRAVPHGGLDGGEPADLLPETGRGFMGIPALRLARGGGELTTQSRLCSVHRPSEGAVAFHLQDPIAGIEVELEFVGSDSGVLCVRSAVRNLAADPLEVLWLAAAAIPVDGEEVMTFAGRWAREFIPSRTRIVAGALLQENRTGRTSHHAPPFWVVGEEGFGERHGAVLGIHLAWSGNHRGFIERLRDGALQFQAGELLAAGEVCLRSGERLRSPDAFIARSERGLAGLSDRFHPFLRTEILKGRPAKGPRVHLNTWEAVYFDHDPVALEALAQQASDLGVERFVLDDGWFKGRNDDTAGLGDWTPDPKKYPHGLRPLADRVRALGMTFGLWVEPEMISPGSDLAFAHPEWILRAPGRTQPLGRGQMVLNLTIAEASDHIFSKLDAILRETRADYLKWDMNRDLVHAEDADGSSTHRQTLALYALIDRVRAAHPEIEIETCASGGGRVDFEILRRTDRVWPSDCNDPFDRAEIQRAFSIFLPPEILGSHVGPGEAHTTGRRTTLDLRAAVSSFGAFGVETDVRDLRAEERDVLKGWIQLYKGARSLLRRARTVRLETADPGLLAHMIVDEGEGLVIAVRIAPPRFSSPGRLTLKGLSDGTWAVRRRGAPGPWRRRMKLAPRLALGDELTLPAEALAATGLPLPVLETGGFIIFELKRTGR